MAAFEALREGDPRQVGRYRIVARLGAGGMGRVYLARSPGGRNIAVKIVRDDLAEDPDFRRRFAREVELARRVNGAYTASVVDADPHGSPPWLATVYVPGLSLAEAIAAHGPWPTRHVLALGAALAEALESMHQEGLVHRDLKPSNILLAEDGPRVIDFGISVAAGASVLTRTGMVIGTLGFMSPEQLTGATRVGPAGDVFSLGTVLVYAATGSGPFGAGAAPALGYRVVHEEPDLSALPPELRSPVASCLAKDPQARPPVPALLVLLSQAAGGESGGAEGTWLPGPVAEGVRERTTTALPATPPTPRPPVAAEVPAAPPVYAPTVAAPPDVTTDPPPPGRRAARRGLWLGSAVAAVAALAAGAVLLATTPWEGGPSLGEYIWSSPTGDYVRTSPVLSEGTLYFGSDDGTLYAVDAETGEQIWTLETGDWMRSTPVIADGVVYAGSDNGRLYAMDASSGEEMWYFQTDSSVRSSPVVDDGTVYFGSDDSFLYAIDAQSGEEVWSFETGDIVASSPAVYDGTVYVGSDDDFLYALNTTDGEELWSFETGGDVTAAPAVSDGVVYAGSDDSLVHALDAYSGDEIWTFETGAPVRTRPAVADGTVYFGSGDWQMYAVDTETGHGIWQFEAGDVANSPTVANGTVYFGSGDGHLHALDAGSGGELWAYFVDDWIRPAPTVDEGEVYFSCDDGSVYALTR